MNAHQFSREKITPFKLVFSTMLKFSSLHRACVRRYPSRIIDGNRLHNNNINTIFNASSIHISRSSLTKTNFSSTTNTSTSSTSLSSSTTANLYTKSIFHTRNLFDSPVFKRNFVTKVVQVRKKRTKLRKNLIEVSQSDDNEIPYRLIAGVSLINENLAKGEPLAAYQTLESLRRKAFFPEVKVYNDMIEAWVQQENYFKAGDMYEKMKKDKRKPTPRTFKLLINAFVESNQRGQLKYICNELNAQNFELEQLLQIGMAEKADENDKNVITSEKIKNYSKLSGQIDPQTIIKLTTESEGTANFDDTPGPKSLYDQQLSLETKAVERAVARYQKMMREVTSVGLGASLKPAQQQLLQWYQPLVHAIKAEQKAVSLKLSKDQGKAWDEMEQEGRDEDEDGHPTPYDGDAPQPKAQLPSSDRSVGPYLLLLSPQSLAVIAMHELMGLLLKKTAGVPMVTACMEVGRAVQAEHNVQMLRTERRHTYNYLNKTQQLATVGLVNKLTKRLDDGRGDWGNPTLAQVGAVLIKQALENCRICDDVEAYDAAEMLARGSGQGVAGSRVPAFSHIYRVEKSKRKGYIVAHRNVYWLIEAGHKLRETLNARHLPMVVPPKPWTDVDSGGYLSSNVPVMRMRGSRQQRRALRHGDLTQIYQALNALGSTPWRINQDVYNVAQKAWSEGGGVAALPPREDITVPAKPPQFDELPYVEKVQHHSAVRHAEKVNAEMHSMRCDTMLKLQVAKELLSKSFYMPHNLDFRGRAYPVPPHLNHIGNDLCRGIMWFDQAKPLGSSGLRWLKIHLANVFGNNKLSFDERAQFTDDNIDKVFDSALRPLDGNRWWLDADDPWQTLAACMELRNALESPNPLEYLSRLPIHQDGTCNGLQHYAALGGDRFGARQVNLEPADRPQDVYSGVAELVAARVEADALAGNPIANKVRGGIDRRIVKQTVMTSVYGVTFPGASAQIRNRLKESRLVDEADIPQTSTYLTRLTFDALREMFLGARTIMEWLGTCARLIAKAGNPVAWTTPLGLPVVQPYRRAKPNQQVRTLVQTVVLAGPNDDVPVHVARQQSAFPPNYVHSLDSTHMLLTAKACQDAGITYASVHDSFWTHASTVPQMARLLRQEFVELHSQPLLEHLRAQLQAQNPGVQLPPLPPRGDLDLSCVLSSPYFFS